LPVVLLVSIHMITYNHEPYIARAIEGVIGQRTSFPFELVIGEDCSTDATRAIVLDYQEKYPGIIRVVVSEDNVGWLKNSLRTTRACSGKYMAYCEGDDYWHNPDKLQLQVDFLEAHPDYGMVHGDNYRWDVEKKKYGQFVKSMDADAGEPADGQAFYEILTEKRRITTLTVCVRKELISQVIENNPECASMSFLMGDLQCWLEVSRLAKVKYLDQVLATYSILSHSASHGDCLKMVNFARSIKELRYHYLGKYRCPEEVVLQTKYNCIVKLLAIALRSGNLAVADAELGELRALGFTPPWTWKDHLLYWGCKNALLGRLVTSLGSLTYLKRGVLSAARLGGRFRPPSRLQP
jgi:glycosyltransferase involved in cell wall biosynthesis